MIAQTKLHIPVFVDHIGIKDVYNFYEDKIKLFDMSFMDAINITKWKFEVLSKEEVQYVSNIKMFKLDDNKRILNRAKIYIHVVQNFKKRKHWIEIGSSKLDEVASTIAGQELQVYPVVINKYPQHFDIDRVTNKLDDYRFIEEKHYYHILKQTKFESKAETVIWNLGHCMYWYLKELNAISSRKSDTAANRFAFLWLYEFRGQKVDWKQTEFAK